MPGPLLPIDYSLFIQTFLLFDSRLFCVFLFTATYGGRLSELHEAFSVISFAKTSSMPRRLDKTSHNSRDRKPENIAVFPTHGQTASLRLIASYLYCGIRKEFSFYLKGKCRITILKQMLGLKR